jgi:hypothetical protein
LPDHSRRAALANGYPRRWSAPRPSVDASFQRCPVTCLDTETSTVPARTGRRIFDTRFRNGSSVTDGGQGLMCCFAPIIGRRTRSYFALASRFARMIEWSPGSPCGWFPARNRTEADASLLLSVPSSWPPCSSRRRCQWWRLRHRSATPLGAVDSGDATWTISGRGSGDPEPKDSRTAVVVGRGQSRLAGVSRRKRWLFVVVWRCLGGFSDRKVSKQSWWVSDSGGTWYLSHLFAPPCPVPGPIREVRRSARSRCSVLTVDYWLMARRS